MIKVVCAVIINDGLVLVAQRGVTMSHSGKWEFPGGKVENDESEITSLIREIREELQITIQPLERLTPIFYAYNDKTIELIPYSAILLAGVMELKEHADVKYLNPNNLLKIDWIEADIAIVHQVINDFDKLKTTMNQLKNRTLVIGASPKEDRYSNMAVKLLKAYHHPVIALGLKEDMINDTPIITDKTTIQEGIDTITMYVSDKNQEPYYDYILATKPRRVIFNPGTENESFYSTLDEHGIEHFEACTLVMLRTGQF
jgi:mutator protein MutT